MKKLLLLFSLTLFCHSLVRAQDKTDSLTNAYKKNKQDTTLVQLLNTKAIERELQKNTDSGFLHTRQALALSRRIHYERGEAQSMMEIAGFLNEKGDLPGSLKVTFEVLPMAGRLNDDEVVAECYNILGLTYSTLKDGPKALAYYHKGLAVAMHSKLGSRTIVENNNLSREFLDMNQLDSAQWYNEKAYALALKKSVHENIGFLIRNFGIIQFKKGNFARSLTFFKKSAAEKQTLLNHYLQGEDYRRMAEAYRSLNDLDSCIVCAKIAYEQARLEHNPNQVMQVTSLLTDVFKAKNDYKQAYEYQQAMLMAQDSLFSQQKTLQVQNLTYSEQERQDALKAATIAYQNKVRLYTLIGILAVVVLILVILWFNNSNKKKANRLLQERNDQIEKQRQVVENTLSELRATQTQLIQSEKMASLGELTAGIAHEIQNPLNFVNNFSEVNKEMLEELKAESKKPIADRDGQLETELIDGLIANEEKISHHGKRADFIVKGMLQHSRTSTGEKQLTNINILADEFLKLSYHGLRAKDKSFNADLVTHFDKSLPKVNIAQQDIGRVLLNLFNNAFYAVNQKQKTARAEYKPEVTVSTSTEKNNLIIKVKDNGNGIPDAIKDKIMQPFFTTKPTGEGTGLGLSLSYDIVVKGHGGTLDINSNEGEGSVFTVYLPIS
jgi:two-component system NtrC family sensor kinase